MFKHLFLITAVLLLAGQLTAQVNLKAGLLVHYPFNGNFNDASGNNNHGVQHGNISFTANQLGMPNMAAHFDGIDDWLECPASPQTSPNKELTVSFRFKTDDIRWQTLVSKADFYPGPNGKPNNIQYVLCFNHH